MGNPVLLFFAIWKNLGETLIVHFSLFDKKHGEPLSVHLLLFNKKHLETLIFHFTFRQIRSSFLPFNIIVFLLFETLYKFCFDKLVIKTEIVFFYAFIVLIYFLIQCQFLQQKERFVKTKRYVKTVCALCLY